MEQGRVHGENDAVAGECEQRGDSSAQVGQRVPGGRIRTGGQEGHIRGGGGHRNDGRRMRPAGLSARVPHQDRAVLGDDVLSLGQRQLKAARAPLIRFSEGQVVRGEVDGEGLHLARGHSDAEVAGVDLAHGRIGLIGQP